VLAGFATIGTIIGLGFLLAHLGVLRADSELLLTRLVFFVATPALLFKTLSTAPVGQILTSGLAAADCGSAATSRERGRRRRMMAGTLGPWVRSTRWIRSSNC